ncbi:MAG TPA: hypothetical protein VF670_14495 [Duganella sp.]|jgi:hypothetical protein
MITYLATPQTMTMTMAKPRNWKALVRRAFELWGAPYADSPYMPL